VKLEPGDYGIQENTFINAFFRFRGRVMTFSARVLEVTEEVIVTYQPEKVFRDLSRGFERIMHPEGISVSLVLEGKTVELSYPASEMYEPVEPPDYDPGFDATKIQELLKTFRERASHYASDSKIVMFRERKPQTTPEGVVARSGKAVILPLNSNDVYTFPKQLRERMLEQDEIIRLRKQQGMELHEVQEELTNHVRFMTDNQINRELYVPILYHQYVVGYLYLFKSEENRSQFHPKAVELCLEFGRILSYALQVNGYFRPQPGVVEYEESELIDISGSGMLFTLPQDGPDLSLYTEVELKVQLESETIPANGKVVRKFGDNMFRYYGVKFINISTEGMEKLFDRLYGADYRGDIDSVGLAEAQDPETNQFG
jgi:hypothetical protein